MASALGTLLVACASVDPCVDGMEPDQDIEIWLGAEYVEESAYEWKSYEVPGKPSCDAADGLSTGMVVRVRTADEGKGRFCQTFDFAVVMSTLGTIEHDIYRCADSGWVGGSNGCSPVMVDGCSHVVTYHLDWSHSETRMGLGKPLETSGHPAHRFTRVLVPDPAGTCPELAEHPGCADTWVVTLNAL